MTTRNLMRAALEYAAQGWHVVPLGHESKEPNFNLLPLRDPTQPKSKTNKVVYAPLGKIAATEAQIRAWWAKDPGANVGLICSYSSGLMVVDLDPNKKDGPKSYRLEPKRRKQLLEREGFEHTPLVVKTTSGGWHLYYRHPRAPTRIVPKQKHKHDKDHAGGGVDVQGGECQYVVAPPSKVRGKPYSWNDENVDISSELPPPPTWTIALASEDGYRVYTKYWFSLALESNLPEGGVDGGPGRNQTLRSLALSMAKTGEESDKAFAHLTNWNLIRCKPPLTEAEVYRQVHHMYEKAAKDMGVDGSDNVVLQYNGPTFPFEALRRGSPRVYRWVQTMTNASGAHPDMVASAGLIGLSTAAIFCRIEIEGVDWTPPAHLWGTIVADSGTRKSKVFEKIMSALQPTRDALAHVASRFNNAVNTERDILDGVRRSAKSKLSRKSSDPDERQRLMDANFELQELPEPLPSSWTTTDATPEAFLVKMASIGWIGLASDEGADALKGFFGHYSGKSDISGILKGYDLGSSEQDRISRASVSVKKSRASLFIMTQPSVLAGLDRTEAEDRGFLARMQFCIPNEDAVVKLPACSDDPETVFKDFESMMLGIYYGGDMGQHKALLEYEPEYAGISFDDDEMVAPNSAGLQRPTLRHEYSIKVSAEVWAVISQFQTEMSEQSRNGAAHHTAASWCKKAGEHALRLAVVMELAESDGKARELTAPRAVAAIEIVRDYFLYQYYVAVDRMSRPRIAAQAMHVLRRFRDHESFSTVDVTKDLRCTTEEAVELCRWLSERGTLSVKGRGRNLVCKVLEGVKY